MHQQFNIQQLYVCDIAAVRAHHSNITAVAYVYDHTYTHNLWF